MGSTTGKQLEPTWINGAESAAPGGGTQLVKVVVTAGKIGLVYGFRVVSQEANAAGKIWRLRASIQGTTIIIASVDVINPTFISRSPLFMFRGNGVDFYEAINVVAATASTIHQVSILYGEMETPMPLLAAEVVEGGT